jgi:hypothetical protein
MNLLRFQYREASRACVGILFSLLLANASTLSLHAASTLTLYAQHPGTAIVFYAQPQISEELWPDLLQSLRTDLDAGTGELPNGFALDQSPTFFRGDDDRAAGIDFSHVIVVKLLGRCDVLPQASRPSPAGPLGWVPRVSGEIQPFIFVDCNRIAQVLRPTSAGLNKRERQHEMAQAIAHVLIHEWIHIAAQNPSHDARGITKQVLSVDELIAEPRNNRLAIATR